MIDLRYTNSGAGKTIRRMLKAAAIKNYFLTPQSKILEIGCRKGEAVLVLRKLGFDAYGFDIHDYFDDVGQEYRKYFFSFDNPNKKKGCYLLDWDKYRLPFEDGEFDLVFSNTVFEHIANHDVMLREISRILKKPGISLHKFRPGYRLIDRHSYLPFGGLIRNYHYYLFWAMLGFRNKNQVGKSAGETAEINLRTATQNLHYLSSSRMLKISGKYFTNASFIPQVWNFDKLFLKLYLSNPLTRYIYSNTCNSILFLEK